MADIKINGLVELDKMLKELPAKIEANVIRGGLRAAAKVVLDEAKRLCPVEHPSTEGVKQGAVTGELQRSIRISGRMSKGRVTYQVRAGNAKAFYAHMVEYGTARHFIKPKGSRSALFFAGYAHGEVDHPGAKAKPFMRPAIDNKAREAVDTLSEYIVGRLPKEVAKLK